MQLKYIKDRKSVKKSYIRDILSIHQKLVKKRWVKDYYQNESVFRIKVLDELANSKDLLLAIENQTVIGFSIIDRTDSKITLIEVDLQQHRKQIGCQMIQLLQSKYDYLKTVVDALKPEGIISLLSSMGFNQKNKREWEWNKLPL